MPWQHTPYTAWLLVSAVVSGLVVVWAWRYRRNPGVPSFAILMVAVTEWSLAYALGISSVMLPEKLLFAKLMYVGIAAVPVAWLLFTLEYTGRVMPLRRDNLVLFGFLGVTGRDEYLTRRNLLLVLVIPVLTVLLTVTNGRHNLVWSSTELVDVGGIVLLSVDYGPWFWVHSAYSYLLLAAGAVIIAQLFLRSRRLYRGQAATVLVAIAVPWAANAAYLTGTGPTGGFDPTPIGFTATGVVMFAAFWRYRLLDIVPIAREVARDEIIEDMDDGVVVLDRSDRIVDINRTARSLVGDRSDDVIGRSLTEILPAVGDLVTGDTAGATEIEIEVDDVRVFEARVSPVATRSGLLTGRVILLRDVTDRYRRERRFESLVERSTDVIVVLDTNGNFTYVSPAVERIFGYDRDDLVGDLAFEYVHPEDRDDVVEAFSTVIERPEVTETFEYRNRTASGEWTPAEARVRNLLDDPSIDGIVVYVRDVSGRRDRERRLGALHETARELLEARDGDTVVDVCVGAAESILGLDVAGILLRDPDGVLVPASVTDDARALFGEIPRFEPGVGIAGTVIETGEPVITDDVTTHDKALNPETPVRSEMVLPIGDHGVFIAASRDVDAFDDVQISLARVLVSTVEAALDSVGER